MSPSIYHDGDADFLGVLIRTLTEEFSLPCRGGGSVTLRRRLVRRGLEPDRCFWITNEAAIRGKRRLDLRVDPPPDLAIEVDVTSSSLDRMSIYAALGVPEVWRLDNDVLTFHALTTGNYIGVTQSRSFPSISPGDLMPFMARHLNEDENEVVRQFRAWLRQ